jgi:hypothetical protein
MNITFEFACQDDCLNKMVPSDLRGLVCERDELQAKFRLIRALIAEEASTHGIACDCDWCEVVRDCRREFDI